MKFKKPKLNKKKFLSFVFSFIAFIAITIIFIRITSPVQAAWFDDTYAFRVKMSFTHNAAIAGPTSITYSLDTAELISANLMQSDCDDIRFTDINGNPLPYDLTGTCNNAATTFEVIFPSIINGTNTAYVYYANPSATNSEINSVAMVGITTLTPSGGDPADTAPTASDEQGPAPISYWNFDEGTGSTVNDYFSQQNNDLTITNALWKSSDLCIFGSCLYFDGNGDYANKTYSSDTELLPGTNGFTISTWAKHSTTAGADTLIARVDGVNGVGWKLYMNSSGFICFGIDAVAGTFPNDSACTTTSYADSQWHYIAGVKTGTTNITIFVDGAQITQTSGITSSSLDGTNASFTVGNDFDNGTNGWDGFIDQVKYYNFAKTATQIKTEYASNSQSKAADTTVGTTNTLQNLGNGLVGYWKMDESSWATNCSTASAVDSSGNGFNAAPCPNASAAALTTSGKFGSAGSFDGTDDYLSMGNVLDQTGSSPFSMSVWFKTSYVGTNPQTLIGKSIISGNFTGYQLGFNIVTATAPDTGKLGFALVDDNLTIMRRQTSSTYNDGNWHHVTVTYDGSKNQSGMNMYIDGKIPTLVDSGSTSFPGTLSNAANFEIGGRDTTNQPFTGTIDDARMYNRSLSFGEATNLYNLAPGPIGYWKFDDNTGTTPVDSSTAGANGTFTGTPIWSTGKYGAGLTFNGSSTAVTATITDPSNLNTVEVWVNPVTSIASKTLITSAKLATNASSQPTYGTCTGTAISLNTWTHIAAVSNGASICQIYQNGVLTASNTTGVSFSTSVNIAASSYAGAMDDVRIYNYPRTSKQINEDMNAGHPTVGTPVGAYVGYWNFDELNGTTANDRSINANSLTLSAASWTNNGRNNGAWNGTGSVWLTRADDDDFDFAAADDFSISFWFKSDAAANPSVAQYAVEKGTITNTGTAGYIVYANTSGNIVFGIKDDAAWGASSPSTVVPDDTATSTTDIYDTTWHHIVAVKTGTSRIDLYVDGKLNASDTSIAATGTLANAIALRVGDDDADATNAFAGDIDELKIYRSALTPADVQMNYNSGFSMQIGSNGNAAAPSPGAQYAQARTYCVPGESATCTGPAAEWHFDDGAGAAPVDKSGNGVTGTMNGTTYKWVAGKKGYGLKLFGPGDYMTVAANANVSTATWTLNAWINPVSLADFRTIFWKGADVNNASNYDFQVMADGSLFCEFESPATSFHNCQTGAGLVTTDKWHFASCTFSNPNMKIYYNGIPQTATCTSTAFTPVTDSTRTLYVGRDPTNSGGSFANDWVGSLDEIQIFNYARTQSQIALDYNRGGPAIWSKLDECQDTTANDSSDKAGTSGTITIGGSGTQTSAGNCTASSTAWGNGVNGKFNSSLNFDGTDDYITYGNPAVAQQTTQVSLSAWVYYNSTPGLAWTKIFGKWNETGNQRSYALANSAATGSFMFYVDSAGNGVTSCTPSSSVTPSTNTWYHVVGTYDGSNCRLYVNGQLVTTSAYSSGIFNGTGNLIAGGSGGETFGGSTNYVNGKLDDLKMFTYGLTADQVKTLYNEGSAARFGPVTGAPMTP